MANVANDVLKKLGGGRVQTMVLDNRPRPLPHPGSDRYQEYKPMTQPGFDVTLALRDRALQGVPLFSKRDSAQSRLRALLRMRAVVVSDDAIRNAPDIKAARAIARDVYKQLRQSSAHTRDGRTVRFGMSGFKETAQHAADRRVLEVIPQLRELIKELCRCGPNHSLTQTQT